MMLRYIPELRGVVSFLFARGPDGTPGSKPQGKGFGVQVYTPDTQA